jgi:hypothetical protein
VCGSLDEFIKQVKIAPNPATQEFIIELPGDFSYELLDARGRLVTIGKGSTLHHVNVSGIESGVYMLKIMNQDFEHSFRILKQ